MPSAPRRERRGKPAAVAETARGDHRDLHLVGRGRDQDQAGGVVFARVTGALKAVDRDRIHAHALRRQRVTHAGAFVDHLDAVLLELVDMLLRLVAGGLDDLDAAVDDRLAIFGVGRGLDGRQDRQVHGDRLLGQRPRPGDLLAQVVGGRLGQGGDDAEAAGLRHRRGQLCAADPLHPALHNRVLDTDEIGEACSQHKCSPAVSRIYRRSGRAALFMKSDCRRGTGLSITGDLASARKAHALGTGCASALRRLHGCWNLVRLATTRPRPLKMSDNRCVGARRAHGARHSCEEKGHA